MLPIRNPGAGLDTENVSTLIVCLLVCAVRGCLPALSFCLGLERCPLLICALGNVCHCGKGGVKSHPECREVPDSPLGSLPWAAEGPWGSGAQHRRSPPRPGHVPSQQRGL